MQIEAVVVAALQLEKGVSKSTGNPWSKGTLIVEVGSGSQYPKKVALTNMKKAEEFVALPIGGAFTFDIDVESREYNGKWFTNVNCFRWTPIGAQPQQQAPTYAPQPAPQPQYAPQPMPGNPYAQPQGNPYAHAQPQDDNNIPF